MEMVYAAMLLHKAGQKIDESNVKKVLEAAGIKKDDAQIKALVAALDGVNIDDVIKEAGTMPAAAPGGQQDKAEKQEEKKEEKKEEKVDESKATAGLSSLFG